MILIGGGSRSGKSTAALRMLQSRGPRRAFIATAQALDDEMADRILRHRAERSPEITTLEEPTAVADLIVAEQHRFDAMVVDCLTVWLSNLMLAGESQIDLRCEKLVSAASEASAEVILVTNEVGAGIVPDNQLARRFRDEQGRLNQMAAAKASEVYFTIFGIANRLK